MNIYTLLALMANQHLTVNGNSYNDNYYKLFQKADILLQFGLHRPTLLKYGVPIHIDCFYYKLWSE